MDRRHNVIRYFEHMEEHATAQAKMVRMTPEVAQVLLARNEGNRKVRPTVVRKYKLQMDAGEWYPCSAGVGVSDDGALLNGQHRLQAIVELGKPQWTLVVWGLPTVAREAEDRGANRTISDIFAFAGFTGVARAAQIAKWFAIRTAKRTSLADVEVKEAYLVHEDGIDAVAPMMGSAKGVDTVGVGAAIVRAYEVWGEKAVEFYRAVRVGHSPEPDSPAFRLWKVLTDDFATGKPRSVSGRARQAWDYEKTCYAFNAWIRGQRINAVRSANTIVLPEEV